jgi:hypothetical protein
MKKTSILILLVALIFGGVQTVQAGVAQVTVQCEVDPGPPPECVEMITPDPVMIVVGDQVEWMVSASCGVAPCLGACTITVPAGPGFAGFGPVAVPAAAVSAPTPVFGAPGVFPYTVACSEIQGTIIVTEEHIAIPSLTQWGLIILVTLIVISSWVIIRRRRAAVSSR